MLPYVPEGLEDFVDKVIPELQRRGLFRREYEGKSLRENLGLPRPENQFFRLQKNVSGEEAEAAPALRPSEKLCRRSTTWRGLVHDGSASSPGSLIRQ